MKLVIGSTEFKGYLERTNGWQNMKGYSYQPPWSDRLVVGKSPEFSSSWWRYRPDVTSGACCYVNLNFDCSEIAKVVVISTPPEFRRKGIAKEALKSLMEITDCVDRVCVENQKFHLGHCYSLMLVPNPVDVHRLPPAPPTLYPDGEPDWTSNFDMNFLDETFTELGKYCDKPMDMDQLTKFYMDLGFVSSDVLTGIVVNGQWKFNMAPRAKSIGRKALMYPERNLEKAVIHAR